MKKIVNKKKFFYHGGVIVLALGMSVGGIAVGVEQIAEAQYSSNSAAVMTNYYSNTSCFDEALAQREGLSEAVNKVEMFLALSDELEKLELTDIIGYESKFEIIDPVDVITKIRRFNTLNSMQRSNEEEKEFVLLSNYLNTIRKNINKFLGTAGYSILEEYELLLIKSKVCDAKGIDEKFVDCLSIPENSGMDNNCISFNAEDFKTDMPIVSRVVNNYIENLYTLQRASNKRFDDSNESYYSSERNELLSESIEASKDLMAYTLKIENGKIDDYGRKAAKSNKKALIKYGPCL